MAIWNERIHERRLEKGITLAQIAEKLGVTEATAQRYECGNIKSIPYEYMCAYGEILNCSPCYLMGWEEKEYTKESSPKIMQYYELLNDIGKHEATKRVEEMTHAPQYMKEDTDYLAVRAAHNDAETTDEELEKMERDSALIVEMVKKKKQ